MSRRSLSACLPSVSATSHADVHQRRIESGDRSGRRVHHHQRVDALGVVDGDAAGDHAAHRVAEQPELIETGRVGDRERVGSHPVERVRRGIGRVVARAVTTMIEDHDRVIACEHRDVIGEIFLRAAQPVHQHEPGTLAGHLDREPDTVVHRDPHVPMVTRMTPPSPPRSAESVRPGHVGCSEMPGEPAVERRSGTKWKVALRLLVSAVFLGVLVSRGAEIRDSIPRDHPLQTALLLSAAVVTMLVGIVLSAWRWQEVLLRVRRARLDPDAHRPPPRGSVRRQRAAVDDRRRRVAGRPRCRRRSTRRRPRSPRSCSSGSAACSRCRCSSSSGSRSTRRCSTPTTRGSRCSSPGSHSASWV